MRHFLPMDWATLVVKALAVDPLVGPMSAAIVPELVGAVAEAMVVQEEGGWAIVSPLKRREEPHMEITCNHWTMDLVVERLVVDKLDSVVVV